MKIGHLRKTMAIFRLKRHLSNIGYLEFQEKVYQKHLESERRRKRSASEKEYIEYINKAHRT